MTRDKPRLKKTSPPHHCDPKRSKGSGTHPPPRCKGVVMVIALLAIVLIASLLFYVINVGRSVQGRVVTQHAADSAAIGGAAQVARSMNTVAMNNVETARLITAVSVLDGLPLAVDMSITDATEEGLGDLDAVGQSVSAQINSGVIDTWFDSMLRTMMDGSDSESVVSEQRHLRELDELFRNQPDLIPQMTHYIVKKSGEMGSMHKAMRSMDAHSRAVMQTFGETAQSAATRSVHANLGNDDPGNAGLLLPAVPGIPWERGVFDDFERPVRYGMLPGQDRRLVADSVAKGFAQVDDEITNRGPWDAVFGWRLRVPDPQPEMPGISNAPVPNPPSDPQTGYKPFGPETMLIRGLFWSPYSQLRQHIWNLYSTKSNYLWDGEASRDLSYGSNWEIDIDHDDERSTDRNSDYVFGLPRSDIRQTAFVIGEIKSRLADEQGHPGRKGITWNNIHGRGRRHSPFVIYRGGWFDPRDGSPIRLNPQSIKGTPTWRKVQDHIWRLSAVYETDPLGPELGGDLSIGLPPKRSRSDADGNSEYQAQEVYWEIDVMLIGVNVGPGDTVRNPWEGFDRNSEDAPAPIDFIHEQFQPNDTTRRQSLTFLGVARQPSRPDFWPTRFNGDRAYPYNSAIAQAYVFNNHSWDMWTQTWQAQLQPVTRFDDWVDQADDATAVVQTFPELVPWLEPDEVEEVAEYLRSVQTLAPVMLNH